MKPALFFALVLTAQVAIHGNGAEVPPPSNMFYLQTNGPSVPATTGDWYTSTAGGHHYLTFYVPCGWPSSQGVHVDLFSPEINANSPLRDEVTGGADSTQFELYGPGASVTGNPQIPAPGTGSNQTTYPPSGSAEGWVRLATLSAPVTCGSYVVRSAVLGMGNDENSWAARIGLDNDASAASPPPANYDNPDGANGTNDEIVVGVNQVTLQHDAGAISCDTLYEFVNPGLASVTFHNFDFDGGGRVRYYRPGIAVDPNGIVGGVTGTVSTTNGTWNGSEGPTRGGDVIPSPAPGWWRIVTCMEDHEQVIQEGQVAKTIFFSQPPTPNLSVTKTDGLTQVDRGQVVTYTVNISNTANGATAGAATSVTVTDNIPSNSTFVACSIGAGFTGTCTNNSGVVTANLNQPINASGNPNSSGQITVTVQVNANATSPATNNVSVAYQDSFGNPFPTETAQDVDTVNQPPDAVNDAGSTLENNAVTLSVLTNDTDPEGDSVTITAVTNGAGGVVSFSASSVTYTPNAGFSGLDSFTYTITDGHNGFDTATVTVQVNQLSNLLINQSDAPDPVNAGSQITYTIPVTNNGPSPASNLIVNHLRPAGFVVGTVTPSQGPCVSLPCNLGTLAVGNAATVTVIYNVAPSVPPGLYTVTATAQSDSGPQVSDLETSQVNSTADLFLTKSDSPDPAIAGQRVAYTITVTSGGPSNNAGFQVGDTMPPGTAYFSSSPECPYSALLNSVTCTTNGLNSGASVSYQVTVTVLPGFTGSTITNTAQLISNNTPDHNPSNNSATSTTTVQQQTDLTVIKTDSLTGVTAGDGVTYTFTISVINSGPSNALGVVIADTFPAGYVRTSLPSSCLDGIGDNFTCTFSSVPGGGTASVQVTYVVPASTPVGTQTNNVSITSVHPGDTPSGNSASDLNTVSNDTEISLTKTDGIAGAVAGDGVTYTYTIGLTNAGPSDATNVTIADSFPVAFTRLGLPAGCTAGSGGNFTCSIPTLPASSTAGFAIPFLVPSSANSGPKVNTVDLTSTHPGDAQAGNTATDTTVVGEASEISITKNDGITQVVAGDGVTYQYTIIVSNAGPSDADNVTVGDTFPAAFTRSPLLPPACNDAGGGNFTCAFPQIPANQSRTINIAYTVPSGTPTGLVTNTVSLTSGHPGDAPAGNSVSDTNQVVHDTELSVSKTDNQSVVVAGDGTVHTYSIVVTNTGPSIANGVTFADSFPSGFTRGSLPAGCSGGSTFTCAIASLPAGASATTLVTYTVPASTPASDQVNTVTISSSHPGDAASGNTASDTTAVAHRTEIVLSKTDGEVAVAAGDGVVHAYTITVSNSGPSNATGVTIADTFPTGFSRGVLPAGCSPGAGNNFTCAFPVLSAGTTQTVVVSYTVPSSTRGGIQVNTVTLSSLHPGDTSAGNAATDNTVVAEVTEIVLTKTDGVSGVVAGDGLTYFYMITVSNAGPTDATGVVISDTFPSGFVRGALPPECAPDNVASNFVCVVGVVPGRGSVNILIPYTVPPSTAAGTQTNAVSLISSHPGDTSAGNSATDNTTVALSADLRIQKLDAPDPANPLDRITYTLLTTNLGPSNAGAFTVTDSLPSLVTFVGVDSPDCTFASGTITCSSVGLPAGNSVAWSVTVMVNSGIADGTVISNTGRITSAVTPDPASGNNTSTATTTVTAPIIQLVKTASPPSGSDISPGDEVAFTITYSNAGSGAATTLTVTDTVNTQFGAVTTSPGGSFDPVSSTVTWTIPIVAPEATGTVTFTATAGATLNSVNITNIATARAEEMTTPVSSNQTTHRLLPPDVVVIKSSDRAEFTELRAFETVTFFLTVRNRGSGSAQSVIVMDTPPPHMNYVAGSTAVSGTPIPDTGGTSPLFGPGVNIGTLAPSAQRVVELKMTVGISAPAGALLENFTDITWNLGSQTSGDFFRLLVIRPRVGPTLRQSILVQGPSGTTIFVTILNEAGQRVIGLIANTGFEMIVLLILAMAATGAGFALSTNLEDHGYQARRRR